MKLSISKLLIALNCLVIIFWGSIINRMDYTTIIYMGILIIINAIYSLKYKYARNIYWIEIGYLFLILLWFINGIPIYSSICYFIILVEEVHFFLNMFRARRNNDDFAIKIVVWLMGSMAFYGIYEGVTQNNPLFLRFFSENALTDYKNSFLYTYNTVGSMEEALIFAMLAQVFSVVFNDKVVNAFQYFKNQVRWYGKKRKFRRVGNNVHLEFPAKILTPDKIEIGDNVFIAENAILEVWGDNPDACISIGNNVCISSRIHIGCINKVTIASGVLIAGNVLIEDHFHGDVSSSEADIEPNKRILKSRGEISIGENVWIGENVVIMPGVSIGRGCVIGANSTVTKSIPDYAVAAGSPAKIIRRLKN